MKKITFLLPFVAALTASLVFCMPLSASTQDIEQGSPAFSPPDIGIGGTFTVNYVVYLYDLNDQGQEVAAANIKSQTYTLTTADTQAQITSVTAPGFSVSGLGTTTVTLTKSGGNDGPSFGVSADITYPDPGDKSATLSGSFQTSSRQAQPLKLAFFDGFGQFHYSTFSTGQPLLRGFRAYQANNAFSISDMPVLGGPISGGDDVRYYCPQAQNPVYTLTATPNQPDDTNFTWEITTGADKLTFIDPTTGKPRQTWQGTGSNYASCQIQGLDGSTVINDVSVSCSYIVYSFITGANAKYSIKLITVKQPYYIGLAPQTDVDTLKEGAKNSDGPGSAVFYASDDTSNAWYGFRGQWVFWQLKDKTHTGMAGEEVAEHWTNVMPDPLNNSYYPKNSNYPKGTWTVQDSLDYTTVTDGLFPGSDDFGSTQNGRDSHGNDIWSLAKNASNTNYRTLGSATHTFLLIVPNQGINYTLNSTYPTQYRTNGVDTGVSTPVYD